MIILKYRRSTSAFSATPCDVIHRRTCTPTAPTLRSPTHTPVSSRPPGRAWWREREGSACVCIPSVGVGARGAAHPRVKAFRITFRMREMLGTRLYSKYCGCLDHGLL